MVGEKDGPVATAKTRGMNLNSLEALMRNGEALSSSATLKGKKLKAKLKKKRQRAKKCRKKTVSGFQSVEQETADCISSTGNAAHDDAREAAEKSCARWVHVSGIHGRVWKAASRESLQLQATPSSSVFATNFILEVTRQLHAGRNDTNAAAAAAASTTHQHQHRRRKQGTSMMTMKVFGQRPLLLHHIPMQHKFNVFESP